MHKISSPPSRVVYHRDQWYLYFDPTNMKWCKVNEDGKKILSEFELHPDYAEAVEQLKRKYKAEEATIMQFVTYMVEKARYLHRDEYQPRPIIFPPKSSIPKTLYLHPSYRCNLQCVYCYNSKDRFFYSGDESHNELTLEDYRLLFQHAWQLGIKKLVYTGGEPLLRKDLFDIARISKEMGFHTRIITNGTLITRKNAVSIIRYFDQISVSIDSFIAAENDCMRGENSYKRALSGIQYLRKLNGQVSCLGVTHPGTIDNVKASWEYFVKQLGCLTFIPQAYIPLAEVSKELPELDEFIIKYGRIRSQINYENRTNGGIKLCNSCGICSGEIAIGADGNVFPCQSILKKEFCGGNIKRVMESYIRNLVQVGFLHTGTYREKKRGFFYMDVPNDIYIMMTYHCNLKCRYCYNLKDRTYFNQISKNQQDPEMSIEVYRQLVEDAKALGVKRFLFTGGEPLMNPLTLPVGKYAKELGIKTELISNGLLINRDNVKEIAVTFDYISISLDSMDKTTHERMRGKGSYDKVVNSIRLLKANGGKVRAMSVITRVNADQLLETWRGALEELHCDLYTPSLYSPNDNDETTNDELLPEIAELMKEQDRAKAYFKKYPAVVMSETKFRFSCGIANGEIGVAYDGNIYPCHLLHKPELKCGNLREKRLGEILKESELIAKLRAFNIDDIAECQPCDYKYLCGGGCLAMAYNMHGNFSKTKNDYCQYRIHDHIERMWSETISEVESKSSEMQSNP